MTPVEVACVFAGLLPPFLGYWIGTAIAVVVHRRKQGTQLQRETAFALGQIADQHRREWRAAA